MNVSVSRAAMMNALKFAARFSAARSSLPVLMNLLIEVDENGITVSGTNLAMAGRTRIPVDDCVVVKHGSLVVPDTLLDVLAAATGDSAATANLVVHDDEKMLVRCAGKSRVNGIDAQEFPFLTWQQGDGWSAEFDAQQLRRALEVTVFAAAGSDQRPILGGVFFVPSGDVENLVELQGCDGYRLSVTHLAVASGRVEKSAIVPISAAREVLRAIGNRAGTVTLYGNDKRVLFDLGDCAIQAQMLEGQYPDFKPLMPVFDHASEVDTDAFLGAINAADVFAGGLHYINLAASTDGEVVISAESPDRGRGDYQVPVTGDFAGTMCNASYAQEALRLVKQANVLIQVQSNHFLGFDCGEFRYVMAGFTEPKKKSNGD